MRPTHELSGAFVRVVVMSPSVCLMPAAVRCGIDQLRDIRANASFHGVSNIDVHEIVERRNGIRIETFYVAIERIHVHALIHDDYRNVFDELFDELLHIGIPFNPLENKRTKPTATTRFIDATSWLVCVTASHDSVSARHVSKFARVR